MSVDASAVLDYGWRIEPNELPDGFWEMRDDDFQQLDNRYVELGSSYGYELVTQDDDYSDLSAWHISVGISTQVKVRDGDGDCSWHYRNMTPAELAAELDDAKRLEPLLRKLYEEVMGKPPKEPPSIDLYVNWW